MDRKCDRMMENVDASISPSWIEICLWMPYICCIRDGKTMHDEANMHDGDACIIYQTS
jgi:hypothetical protein